MAQPDLEKVVGQFATIFVVCNDDRSALVIPVSTDNPLLDAVTASADLVQSIEAHVVPPLLACMTSDAYVAGISAVGMAPGGIPFRRSYAPITYPGTAAPPTMPSNVAGLITFYADPTDLSATQRMREGKMFVTGLPQSDILGDQVENPLFSHLETLGALQVTGWPTFLAGGTWYRVISKKTQTLFPALLINCQFAIPRNRVATQKRRMQPAF